MEGVRAGSNNKFSFSVAESLSDVEDFLKEPLLSFAKYNSKVVKSQATDNLEEKLFKESPGEEKLKAPKKYYRLADDDDKLSSDNELDDLNFCESAGDYIAELTNVCLKLVCNRPILEDEGWQDFAQFMNRAFEWLLRHCDRNEGTVDSKNATLVYLLLWSLVGRGASLPLGKALLSTGSSRPLEVSGGVELICPVPSGEEENHDTPRDSVFDTFRILSNDIEEMEKMSSSKSINERFRKLNSGEEFEKRWKLHHRRRKVAITETFHHWIVCLTYLGRQSLSLLQEGYSALMEILSVGSKASQSAYEGMVSLAILPYLGLILKLFPSKRAPSYTNATAFIISTFLIKGDQIKTYDFLGDLSAIYYTVGFLKTMGNSTLEVQLDDSHAVGRSISTVLCCKIILFALHWGAVFDGSRTTLWRLDFLKSTPDDRATAVDLFVKSLLTETALIALKAQNVLETLFLFPISLGRGQDILEDESQLIEVSPVALSVCLSFVIGPYCHRQVFPNVYSLAYTLNYRIRIAYFLIVDTSLMLEEQRDVLMAIGTDILGSIVTIAQEHPIEKTGLPVGCVFRRMLVAISGCQNVPLRQKAHSHVSGLLRSLSLDGLYQMIRKNPDMSGPPDDLTTSALLDAYRMRLSTFTDQNTGASDTALNKSVNVLQQELKLSNSTIRDSPSSVMAALNLTVFVLLRYSNILTKPLIDRIKSCIDTFSSRLSTEKTLYTSPQSIASMDLIAHLVERCNFCVQNVRTCSLHDDCGTATTVNDVA